MLDTLYDGDKWTGFNEMTLINGPLIQIVRRVAWKHRGISTDKISI